MSEFSDEFEVAADGSLVEDEFTVGVVDEDTLLNDGDEDDAAEFELLESPYDRSGDWYVIHSYAGYENKVRSNLQARIASMGMEERIFEVEIPVEDVTEFKNGKKVTSQKKRTLSKNISVTVKASVTKTTPE